MDILPRASGFWQSLCGVFVSLEKYGKIGFVWKCLLDIISTVPSFPAVICLLCRPRSAGNWFVGRRLQENAWFESGYISCQSLEPWENTQDFFVKVACRPCPTGHDPRQGPAPDPEVRSPLLRTLRSVQSLVSSTPPHTSDSLSDVVNVHFGALVGSLEGGLWIQRSILVVFMASPAKLMKMCLRLVAVLGSCTQVQGRDGHFHNIGCVPVSCQDRLTR